MKGNNDEVIARLLRQVTNDVSKAESGDPRILSSIGELTGRAQRMIGGTFFDWVNLSTETRTKQTKLMVTWAAALARATEQLDSFILNNNVSRSIFSELHTVLSVRFAEPTGYVFWTPGLNVAVAAATPFMGFTYSDMPSSRLDVEQMARKQEKEIQGLVNTISKVPSCVVNPSDKAQKRILAPNVRKAVRKLVDVSLDTAMYEKLLNA